MNSDNIGLADTMSGVTGTFEDSGQQVDENGIFSSTQKGIAHKTTQEQSITKVELPEGTLLDGKYRILSVVGKGGFGIVYKAADQQNFDRIVAVKTLKHNIDDFEVAKKRFLREIELCSKITSEHAVKIYDSGEVPDGSLYYVMEFLNGTSLDDHLGHREKFNLIETKNLLIQALDALGEAHADGIIHRDIKPANICLLEEEEGSRKYFVKVLDFGIAKMIAGEDQNGGEKLTQTGAWMGSPQYMSPEHLRGGTVTPQSDVFAIGLMAIEMLTGFPAVEGDSPMDVAMIIMQHNIFIEDWIMETSLGPILERCTNTEPTSRYQDANALREALEEIPDSTLINEYNSLKIAGKLSNRRKTITHMENVQTPGPVIPTTTGLTIDERRQMNIQFMLIIGIVILVMVIITGIIIKVLVPDDEETAEQPVHVQGLMKGVINGYNVGAYEPIRMEILIESNPEGATVYRASDMSEIGRTPLTVKPYMIPYNAGTVAWKLIVKGEDTEESALSIVPKFGASPKETVQLRRSRGMRDRDGRPGMNENGNPRRGPDDPDGAKPAAPPDAPKPTEPEVKAAAPEPEVKAAAPAPAKADSKSKSTDKTSKTSKSSKSDSSKSSKSSGSGKKKSTSWSVDSLMNK